MEPDRVEAIVGVCVVECRRQQDMSVQAVANLLAGYAYALQMSEAGFPPTLLGVLHVAALVKPSTNGEFRTTPVTFAGGTHQAAPASEVDGAIRRMFAVLEEVGPGQIVAREFTRAFLAVHPFADGNGRVAFVLFNWLYGTLPNPAPLPDFNWNR